jgi:hypothetical protein
VHTRRKSEGSRKGRLHQEKRKAEKASGEAILTLSIQRVKKVERRRTF